MKSIFTFFLSIFLVGSTYCQIAVPTELDVQPFKCGNNYIWEKHCKEHGLDPSVEPTEEYIRQFISTDEARPVPEEHQRGTVYIIPVVFTIVHQGGVENISDAQVLDALSILNRDFRMLNSDTTDVIPAFKSIVADCEIEFRLAQKDAQGNCVTGINRVFSATTNVGDETMINAVHYALNGGTSSTNIRFPRNKYMNVWICKNANGAAGYTTTPVIASFSSNTDGIVINHNYLGSIGTSMPLTSRALTHEVGHWLNLSHVWGNNNNPGVACGDDGVTDTPQTEGWTTCNLAGATCGSVVDNVQNYMEYSYCSRMFTEGQKTRMHNALTNTGFTSAQRYNLWSATNLANTGVSGAPTLCVTDFLSDEKIICAGDSIAFSDLTYHGATQWNWNFPSGSPSTSTSQNPVITYSTPGQYTVDLTAGNGTSSLNVSKSNYVTVLDPVGTPGPIFEGFESMTTLPDANWYIDNTDGMQKWELFTGAGATGSKCIMLDNFTFNASGGKDVLLSRMFDLTNIDSVEINFKYAYKQRAAGDNDKLKVFVSKNCGQSWSLRKQVVGASLSGGATMTSAFTMPTATDWMDYVVTNLANDSTFSAAGFRFKIEFESDNGNNIFIDDINITGVVGVNEKPNTVVGFTVYPNPTNNSATVEYSLTTAQEVEIAITDVLGKTIVVEKGNKAPGKQSVKLTNTQLQSKGIYFVSIKSLDGVVSKKLIVQ